MTRLYRPLSQRGMLLASIKPPARPQWPLRTLQTTSPPPPPLSRVDKGIAATAPARGAVRKMWSPYVGRLAQGQMFVLALVVGLGAGAVLATAVLPAPVPAAGSREALVELAELQRRVDDEFRVRVFRGKCVSAGRAIRGEGGPEWVEIDTGSAAKADIGEVRSAELRFEREKRANWEAVQEREKQLSAEASAAKREDGKEVEALEVGHSSQERMLSLKQQADALGLDIDSADVVRDGLHVDGRFREKNTLTKTALGGSRGLAVERVFWNADESELVAVVWLGTSLCGWPGVVHGGLLATVISEKAGMAAALYRDTLPLSKTAKNDPKTTESLDIQYKKPTYAGAFYVIRAHPARVKEGAKEGVKVESILETLDGQVCVQVDSFSSG